ncbi:MAG: SPOR domain-containing protein [Rhizomicrobium sp.]
MANFERGSDDVRVFDGGEDEEDVEGSRLPLLIVIALLVLAAFGAVVWLAYQRGVQQGHAEIPRTIAAESGPAKVAPADAGGTQTPYTGLKIYQQHAPSDEEANADTAPPPSNDALKPPPVVAAPVTAPPPVVPKPEAAAKPQAVAPKPAPVVAKPVAETKPIPVESKPVPVKPEPAAAKPVEAAAPAESSAGGSALLQIGSYKSQADADAAWTAYKHKHPGVAGLTTDVKQVDLGEKGTWFRLRIVASKAGAVALCDKLKAEGGACIPSK